MCSVCLRSSCHPRCPYAPDPPAIYTCKYCGEPIIPGEAYLELDGDYYHMDDCANEAAISLLLEKYGATKGIAEDVEPW